MTQKEIEEFLADTKVYVNGKSREIQEKLFSFGYYWNGGGTEIHHTENPFLCIYNRKYITFSNDMNYFTKHENKEITAEEILSLELDNPKYRPFIDGEECWNEMLKHQPFGWMKGMGNIRYNINMVDTDCIYFSEVDKCYYRDAFENRAFADGTPFGIKEE